jgi:hypothetical protein
VQCTVDVETHAYRIFGGDVHNDLSLLATTQPEAGQTKSSPEFWAIVTNDDTEQNAYYPQDTGGSCVETIDQSWPVARVRFSCTGGTFDHGRCRHLSGHVTTHVVLAGTLPGWR